MKKVLGKYFKIGIGTLIPFVIVFYVLNLIYNLFNGVVLTLLPSSISYQWWFVFPVIIGLVIIIELIGFILSFFKLAKWSKKKFDKLVDKVPFVGKLYNFGLELVDSFIADTKGDGEVIIIESGEMCKTDGVMIGVLMDKEHNIINLPTAPNPSNGFLIKTTNYNILGTVIGEMLKIVTSMGKLGGDKWLLLNKDKMKPYNENK